MKTPDKSEAESTQEPSYLTLKHSNRKQVRRFLISYDCPEKGGAHERENTLLALLSNYSPDAKIVLVLAALATQYGDFMVTV
ncbi:Sieve element occlusion N-terminus [Carex littledalei]|uniref:Sieve element occlusion N-terminus n=1 Tax=Carex littledalei TaxID=544730 RepID=A0A833QWM1_9POAL|nr:Sieve element occlusion N-terminus [Carex littledalei]